VSEKDRERRALNVISVSGRSALQKATDPDDRERIRDRVHELLADLEQQVIRDGADPDILAAVERERRRIFE
jgi:hypothetical protein